MPESFLFKEERPLEPDSDNADGGNGIVNY